MDLRSKLRDIHQQHSKVLIVGLGLSGIESALALHRIGIEVVCVESASEEEFRAREKYRKQFADLERTHVPIFFGVFGGSVANHLDQVALCLLSPGIALDSELALTISERGIQITNELDLALSLFGGFVILVTGSNGKSTTVSLIHHLLRAGGKKSHLCGNIGDPPINLITAAMLQGERFGRDHYFVVEASSYQIENSSEVVPDIAVFLNLSPNHLDRHKTLDGYFDAKAKVFLRQSETQIALVNTDDEWGERLARRSKARVIPFYDKPRYDLSECALLGAHNRYNISAATSVAEEVGISPEVIVSALSTFRPLEHRIEQVFEDTHLTVINDSKATTVAATEAALRAVREKYPESGLIVFLGGKAKEGTVTHALWSGIFEELRKNLICALCYGSDGPGILKLCKEGDLEAAGTETLKAAVALAFEKVQALSDRHVVLILTPACASLDQFTDFEMRGNVFKSLVSEALGFSGGLILDRHQRDPAHHLVAPFT